MIRQTYLCDVHVVRFINWLATELESQTLFQHEYVDRRSAKKWACSSLYNAFEKYNWNHPGNLRLGFSKGSCATSNGMALAALRTDLFAAGSSDSHMLQAAADVMAWGGVTAHNNEWLKVNQAGLAHTLQAVQKALDAGDPDAQALRADSLRFNSGMTKVYSLVCENFVIYDSRVAAGLGWFVTKYCQANGLTKVPQALCFPWAAAKEGQSVITPKRRDPGTGTLQFKRLRSGHHHALWNMRASWLLTAVLAHPDAAGSRFHTVDKPNNPLRALEASLFMIGYDLGDRATLAVAA